MSEYDFMHVIYTPQLLDEIHTAGLIAPNHIDTDGCNVQVFYDSPLSDPDSATLTSVISAHVANPSYILLSTQAQIAILVGYLNNANATIANTARAVIVANLASRLPPDLMVTINSQIAYKLGG